MYIGAPSAFVLCDLILWRGEGNRSIDDYLVSIEGNPSARRGMMREIRKVIAYSKLYGRSWRKMHMFSYLMRNSIGKWTVSISTYRNKARIGFFPTEMNYWVQVNIKFISKNEEIATVVSRVGLKERPRTIDSHLPIKPWTITHQKSSDGEQVRCGWRLGWGVVLINAFPRAQGL